MSFKVYLQQRYNLHLPAILISCNGNDAAQSSNSNRPKFQTNLNNGNNGVTFDGNNNWLDVPNDAALKELTYFFVLSTDETADGARNSVFGHSKSAYTAGSFCFRSEAAYDECMWFLSPNQGV